VPTLGESISKYAAMAVKAVHEAEAQLGPGNGRTKQQVAITYILALCHAGERVPVSLVNEIATAVDLVVQVANMFGVFGQVKVSEVEVPGTVKTCGAASELQLKETK